MTVTTERIKDGVVKAIRFIEGGDSVRRACDKAGISVTSLYHNSTAAERNAAFLKNSETVISPDKMTFRGRRRRKVQQRQDMLPQDNAELGNIKFSKMNKNVTNKLKNIQLEDEIIDDYDSLQFELQKLKLELQEANNYISRLKHKLVRAIVYNERVQ